MSRPLAAAAIAVGLLAVPIACGGGGGTSKEADASKGRSLFVDNCGSCHTMATAGTESSDGPNLDHSYAAARAQGFSSSTIEKTVARKIQHPLRGRPCPAAAAAKGTCKPGTQVTPTGKPVMPPNVVTGQDAADVAAFVAECAGTGKTTCPAEN